jgi:TP901 family phage tail tape measure protein
MPPVVAMFPIGADMRPFNAAINDAFRRVSNLPLGRITGSFKEFNKSLEAANARVLAFGASAGILFQVTKGLRELVRATIDVEKALVDINVILGLSQSRLSDFGKSLFDIAKDTGQSFKVISSAAAELARQGLSVEETLRRTKDAAILARLANIDTTEAVESLTAAINSFSKSALTSTEIVNKFATVDAAFAVSSRDLAEAVKRVGSTAEDAGVGLDELVAIVTTLQQTTARGGSVIGNALKTIFTRVQRADTLEQLNALGVEIKDLEGNTLPAIKILKNLADTYDDLGAAQRSQLSELVGGVYQINLLKGALKDLNREYSIYGRALDISKNATDQANKRNEELNKTLAALVNKTAQNFKLLGSEVGKLTLAPAFEMVLGGLNKFIEGAVSQDADGMGANFAKGFLKGFGNFLSGPGLGIAVAFLYKLINNFRKDLGQAFKSIVNLNTELQRQNSILGNLNVRGRERELLERNILSLIIAQNNARQRGVELALRQNGVAGLFARQQTGMRGPTPQNAAVANMLNSIGFAPQMLQMRPGGTVREQRLNERINRQLMRIWQAELNGASTQQIGTMTAQLRRVASSGGIFGQGSVNAILGLSNRNRAAIIEARRELREMQTLEQRGSGFFGFGARRTLQQRAANNPMYQEYYERARSSFQNRAFGLSMGIPIATSIAAQFVGDKTKGQRGTGALLNATGNTVGMSAAGALIAGSRFGPWGAGAGAVLGLALEIPKIIRGFTDELPDLRRELEALADTTARTTQSINRVMEIQERLNMADSGEVTMGAAERRRLTQERRQLLVSLPKDVRQNIDKAGPNLERLREVLNDTNFRNQQLEAGKALQTSIYNLDNIDVTQTQKQYKGKRIPINQRPFTTSEFTSEGKDQFEQINSLLFSLVGEGGRTLQDYYRESPTKLAELEKHRGKDADKFLLELLGGLTAIKVPNALALQQTLQKQDSEVKEVFTLNLGKGFIDQASISKVKEEEDAAANVTQRQLEFANKLAELTLGLDKTTKELDDFNYQQRSNLELEIDRLTRKREENRVRGELDLNVTKFFGSEAEIAKKQQLLEVQQIEDTKAIELKQAELARLTGEIIAQHLGKYLESGAFKDLEKTEEGRVDALQRQTVIQKLFTAYAQTGNIPDDTLNTLIEQAQQGYLSPEKGTFREERKQFYTFLVNLQSDLNKSQSEYNTLVQKANEQAKTQTELSKDQLDYTLKIVDLTKQLNVAGGLNNLLSSRPLDSLLEMKTGLSAASKFGANPNAAERAMGLADFIQAQGGNVPNELLNIIREGATQKLQGDFSNLGLKLEGGTAQQVIDNMLSAKYKQTGDKFNVSVEEARDVEETFKRLVAERERDLRINGSINAELRKQDKKIAEILYKKQLISAADYQAAVQAEKAAKIEAGTYGPKDALESLGAQFKYGREDFFTDLNDAAVEFGQTFKGAVKDAFKEFANGTASAEEALRNLGIRLAEHLLDKAIDIGFDSLIGAVTSVASTAVRSYSASRGQSMGGHIKGYSTGGMVSGGSGNRDDVFAMLQDGEYVIRKSAVKKYGKDTLDKLNNGGAIKKYEEGGEVDLLFKNRYVAPSGKGKKPGYYDVDPNLSAYAQTDENNPQNALKFQVEQSYREYRRANKEAMDQYKRAQKQRIQAAYINAAITVASAGIQYGAQAYGQAAQAASVNSLAAASDGGDAAASQKLANYYNSQGNYSAATQYSARANEQRAFGFESSAANWGTINAGTQPQTRGSYLPWRRADGGVIKRFAEGGMASGRDKIPAWVMGGEYIIKEDVVNRYGVPFFDKINQGLADKGQMRGYAEGGLVGRNISTPQGDTGDRMTETMLRLANATEALKDTFEKDKPTGDKREGQPQEEKGSGGNSTNVSININISKTGEVSSEKDSGGKSDDKKDAEDSRKLADQLEAMVLKIIQEQQRDGGLIPKKR